MEQTRRKALLPASILNNPIVTDLWDGLLLLFALLIVAFRFEVVGFLVYLSLIGLALVLSDRLIDTWVPLILMTVFVTRCYDSFDVFVRYIPLYAAVLCAVLFHVIYYFAKPTLGYSFPGLVAVTVAVTFGGLFSISPSDYFRPMTLYYVLCLGILMPLLYCVAKPRVDHAARDRFIRGLFYAGCLAVYAVIVFYARDWTAFRATHRAVFFQSSNNLSTFLMIALPIGFLYSMKNRFLIITPALMYIALFLSDSRGGILLGTAEFFFLLVFFSFYRSDWFRRAVFILYAVLTVTLIVSFLPRVLIFYGIDQKIEGFSDMTIPELIRALFSRIIDRGEARVGLVSRSLDDFKTNPIFGVGLGYTGNSDLYNPVKGAMNWYHMYLPQIWGGLGIVGIICYGFQLFRRAKLSFTRRGEREITLSLCYFGLLLMSQVNPGEFCPFPYAVIATVIYLLIEQTPDEEKPQKEERTE